MTSGWDQVQFQRSQSQGTFIIYQYTVHIIDRFCVFIFGLHIRYLNLFLENVHRSMNTFNCCFISIYVSIDKIIVYVTDSATSTNEKDLASDVVFPTLDTLIHQMESIGEENFTYILNVKTLKSNLRIQIFITVYYGAVNLHMDSVYCVLVV